MSYVLITHKCSINGTIQTQLLLHRLRVTIHMSVVLTDSVQKYVVVLHGHKKFKCSGGGIGDCVMYLQENITHLDHAEVAVMGENGIHFTVKLFESVLNGVGGQRIISINLFEEMVP